MSDELKQSEWSLSTNDVVQYRHHVHSRIVEDLQDSLTHLNEHHDQLEALLNKLQLAKKQVVDSVGETREHVQHQCSALLEQLTVALTDRQQELESQLKQMEEQSLSPLLECETMLSGAMLQTQKLLQQGNHLAKSSLHNNKSLQPHSASDALSPIVTKDHITKFQKEASLNNCLPSVPDLWSVACVSASFPINTGANVVPLLQQYGKVRRIAPVQITNTEERPGALLVGWEEVEDDDDLSLDDREYELQYSRAGELDQDTAAYSTVYTGHDESYLLQKLTPGCDYWLRVRHKGGEHDDAHAWSLPKKCSTSLPCYKWRRCSGGLWRVADDGRLAWKEGSDPAIITSLAPQLAPDNTLTLQIVSGGGGCSDEGFALSWQPPNAPFNCMMPGTLFFSATGIVLVDGVQRLMQLPSLTSDSCVSFSIEKAPNTHPPQKLRVHIDTQDKLVTYEWAVPVAVSGEPRLYFSACFAQPHWSVRAY